MKLQIFISSIKSKFNNPDFLTRYVFHSSVWAVVLTIAIFFLALSAGDADSSIDGSSDAYALFMAQHDVRRLLCGDPLKTPIPDFLREAYYRYLMLKNDGYEPSNLQEELSKINNCEDYRNNISQEVIDRLAGNQRVWATRKSDSEKAQKILFLLVVLLQISNSVAAFRLSKITFTPRKEEDTQVQ